MPRPLRFLLTAATLLTLTGVAAHSSPPRVTIRVNAAGIMCRVPRDPSNQWLEIGLADYTSHGVQLDGMNAPVTHYLFLPPQHCGVEGGEVLVAYCALFWAPDHQQIVHANFLCPE